MGISYTVKKNDTLWDIARNYNTTVDNLAKWNNIANPDFIQEGQTIYLIDPAGLNLPTTTTTPTTTTANTDKSTTISAPTLNPLPTGPTYDSTKWDDTTKGQAASEAYKNAQSAVDNHGDYKYANQAQLDEIMQSILNRKDFSYDFNEDAFYHQYKDKFIKQGKMASADVMGQAAAMTGGYGNSYAASVGNQAYQASLEQLNDIIPELYQMALDRYNMEGQALKDKYGILSDDYNRGYGEHMDKYNMLMDALGIARSDYYDGANMFYTEQNNANNLAKQSFDDAMAKWTAESDNAWKESDWNRDQAWRDEDIEYQKDRDTVEDAQWQAEFDQKVAQTTIENEREDHKLRIAAEEALNAQIAANEKYVEEQKNNDPPVTPQLDEKKMNNFKKSLSPESAHDAIARQMYGPYNAYVAVELAKDTTLSEDEKIQIILDLGITETDLNYARDKGYDI